MFHYVQFVLCKQLKAKQLVYKEALVDGFQEDNLWLSLYQNDTTGKSILQLKDTTEIQME